MKKVKTWFNWHCPHCQHRNRVCMPFQFEIPQHYTAKWDCDECGKESQLTFDFTISGWPDQRKPPKLRKRRKEKQKLKCDHDWMESVDHPGGSPYWRCKKCNDCKDFTDEEIETGLQKARIKATYINNHGKHEG